jgi:hypothetical protein
MIGAAVLSVLAMAHHPTGTGGHSGLSQLVHGAMMIVVIVMLAGFTQFASRRGLGRFPVLAALVFYAGGAVGNLLAATINGFAVPALAAQEVSHDLFRLTWELNQALAYGAVYASSIAFVLWGADASLEKHGSQRLLGLAGLAAGLAPAALLASDAVDMRVAGALIVYTVQSAFALIVGVSLLRSKRG